MDEKTMIAIYLLCVGMLFSSCAHKPLPESFDFGKEVSRSDLQDDCGPANVHGFCGGQEVKYEKCNARKYFYKNGRQFGRDYEIKGECK